MQSKVPTKQELDQIANSVMALYGPMTNEEVLDMYNNSSRSGRIILSLVRRIQTLTPNAKSPNQRETQGCT